MTAASFVFDCSGCLVVGPVDLSGLAFLLAVALLVAGTVVVCVGLAVGARAIDRVWDRLAPDEDERQRSARGSSGSARVGRRGATAVSRPVLVAILTGALLAALAWLSFTIGRVRDLT
jgi:hypothetical protein